MSGPQLTFFEHLEEFRRRLLVSLLFFCVVLAVLFFVSDSLLSILTEPVRRYVPELYFFSPFEAMVIRFKVAMVAAAVVSFPFWAVQTWLFVRPGLSGAEAKVLLPGLGFMALLFMTGAVFCFWKVLPPALSFLMSLSGENLKPMISATNYLDFSLGMLLAFGISFNLPVFLIGFSALGVINAKGLRNFRKYAILFIFIAAAVLTPSPDVASQVLLAVPLMVLYEISIIGAAMIEALKRKNK